MFRSWNAPVFCKVDEWLQHWGKKPERWPMEPVFTVFEVPFWNIRRRTKGKRTSHFWGKGRLCLLMFGYESETAKHLFVSKIYVLAAQSFPFKVQTVFEIKKGVCSIVLCYKNMDTNRNTSASCTVSSSLCALLSASLLAALWNTRRSDCLTQGQNFEVKNVSFGIWNCH